MKSLLAKTEWVNLPLSVPKPWREWFEKAASTLGGSRNQAMCMALKLGAPLMGRHIELMQAELKASCDRLGAPGKFSEILGAPGNPMETGIPGANEKRRLCSKRKRKH